MGVGMEGDSTTAGQEKGQEQASNQAKQRRKQEDSESEERIENAPKKQPRQAGAQELTLSKKCPSGASLEAGIIKAHNNKLEASLSR